MAISSEAREKMLAINKKKAQDSMKQNNNVKSAVDKAIDDIEKESINTKENTAVSMATNQSKFEEDVPGISREYTATPSDMSIHLKRGTFRDTKNFSKSVRLTEKAVNNMNRVAKEYNISANELINQLLEQLQ